MGIDDGVEPLERLGDDDRGLAVRREVHVVRVVDGDRGTGRGDCLEHGGKAKCIFKNATNPRTGLSAKYGPVTVDDALEVARVASGFFGRGVEARHLRMYRNHAEREAVLFGQVLMPYVRQRNPEARARLQDELGELASLGRQLRTALLREAVRETLAE